MRMKRHQWVRGVLWLVLGVACWCWAASALTVREGLWDPRRVSYRHPGASTTVDELHALRKEAEAEAGGRVTGWAQALSQSVTVPGIDGSATVDVLWVDGDAALVWDLPVLNGHLPVTGDKEGCALDECTALKLFGTSDVVDQSVRLGGQSLIVRGVFSLPEGLLSLGADPGRGLMFAPAAAADGLAITAIEFIVRSEDVKPAEEQINEWMRAAGVSTAGTLDDHVDERALKSLLTSFLAYLLAALILAELCAAAIALSRNGMKGFKALREDRLAPMSRYARLLTRWGTGLLFCVSLAALAALLLPPIQSIPPSYLPTSWADFGFWSTLVTENLQTSAQKALTVQLRPDMVGDSLANWFFWLLLAAVACLWHGRNALVAGADSARPIPACLWAAAVCVAPPLALEAAMLVGWTPGASPAMLALPVLMYALIVGFRVLKLPRLWFVWKGVKRPANIQHVSKVKGA